MIFLALCFCGFWRACPGLSIPLGFVYENRCHGASVLLAQRKRSTSEVVRRDEPPVVTESSFFGKLVRIGVPGEDANDNFLGQMGVPTFASVHECIPHFTVPASCTHIEAALGQGPAFIISNVIPRDSCESIIQAGEFVGFRDVNAGKNNHGAIQIVVPEPLCALLAERIRPHINLGLLDERQRETDKSVNDTGHRRPLVFAGLNRRWRLYRYNPGSHETFAPHIDSGFPPSGLSEDGSELEWDNANGTTISRLTVLFYLNDDFVGGATTFYKPGGYPQTTVGDASSCSMLISVQPMQGSCLVFPQAVGDHALQYARQHWPLHEGSPVTSGTRGKYVVRSDLLFR